MDIPELLLDLAIILFATKALGLLMKKIGLPQVVGAIIAGLLIGPAIWSRFGWWSPLNPGTEELNFLNAVGEIGVILIMFSAGLETDIKELKKTGGKATLIALMGVLVPMILGIAITVPFLGGFSAVKAKGMWLEAVLVGVMLTATSVGVTVESLKELGRLKGRIGQIMLAAAIIGDVIGIVFLSVALSFKSPTGKSPLTVSFMMLGFFAAAIVAGIAVRCLFKWYTKKYPHRRRIAIFSLVVCFVYSFAAEKIFGIADITGAYVAGITLSNLHESEYVDKKIDTNSYMLFAPVFFANIGLAADFSGFSLNLLLFGLAFVGVAILGKVAGSYGASRLLGFKNKESMQISLGMIARGEVALVACKKALESGLFADTWLNPLIPVIMLVIITSLLAPVFLKTLFKEEPPLGGGIPSFEMTPGPEQPDE